MKRKSSKGTKVYTLATTDENGTEQFPRFSFHAVDDADAIAKTFSWARYQGMQQRDVMFRAATNEEIQYNIRDEYIR